MLDNTDSACPAKYTRIHIYRIFNKLIFYFFPFEIKIFLFMRRKSAYIVG